MNYSEDIYSKWLNLRAAQFGCSQLFSGKMEQMSLFLLLRHLDPYKTFIYDSLWHR